MLKYVSNPYENISTNLTYWTIFDCTASNRKTKKNHHQTDYTSIQHISILSADNYPSYTYPGSRVKTLKNTTLHLRFEYIFFLIYFSAKDPAMICTHFGSHE